MKKNEKILAIITAGLGLLALLYVFLIEPVFKSVFVSSSNDSRNQKYIELLDRKDEIQKQAKDLFSSDYWKDTAEEQHIALQTHIENITRKSGITQIKSIYPLSSNNEELVLQVSMDCSTDNLSSLLYRTGASDVPLQVRKLMIHGETGNPNTISVQIELSSIWINALK